MQICEVRYGKNSLGIQLWVPRTKNIILLTQAHIRDTRPTQILLAGLLRLPTGCCIMPCLLVMRYTALRDLILLGLVQARQNIV